MASLVERPEVVPVDMSASIFIDRLPNEVFNYVVDVGHDVQWRTDVAEARYTSDGPVGVGTTGFDRIEANGREMVSEWTVVEHKPDSLVRWQLTAGPILGLGGYICASQSSGTLFTLESKAKPTGYFRLLGPVFGVIGRRQNRADVASLKSILEASS
jgi:hypothetical protein